MLDAIHDTEAMLVTTNVCQLIRQRVNLLKKKNEFDSKFTSKEEKEKFETKYNSVNEKYEEHRNERNNDCHLYRHLSQVNESKIEPHIKRIFQDEVILSNFGMH